MNYPVYRRVLRLVYIFVPKDEVSYLWTTIKECWDKDPEARLTAACVNTRLVSLVCWRKEPHYGPNYGDLTTSQFHNTVQMVYSRVATEEPRRGKKPSKILALVDVKKTTNKKAHGFLLRPSVFAMKMSLARVSFDLSILPRQEDSVIKGCTSRTSCRVSTRLETSRKTVTPSFCDSTGRNETLVFLLVNASHQRPKRMPYL